MMVFSKPINQLKFKDISKLKLNKICESDILDYKREMIDDNKLIKIITAFANTSGGYLIFGVEETGKGGYPKDIKGLDEENINKERIEQILLSNIHPRLIVKIHTILHNEEDKIILILRIPNSYLKPHMNLKDGKYYRRYQFESLQMTELEVSDLYKRRFNTYNEVNKYLEEITFFDSHIIPGINGKITVAPIIMIKNLIDTFDCEQVSWINPKYIDPKPNDLPYIRPKNYLKNFPTPTSYGLICNDPRAINAYYLQIHRNGCIQYYDLYSYIDAEHNKTVFFEHIFCVRLLHTLQFASDLYLRYNYFGDVKIIINFFGSAGSWISIEDEAIPERRSLAKNNIHVEREFSTSMLESNYSFIAKGIMDEILNNYGLWRCKYFDEDGNYILEELKKG